MTKITKLFCLAKLTETDADLFVCDDPKPRKCVGNCKNYTCQLMRIYPPVARVVIGNNAENAVNV